MGFISIDSLAGFAAIVLIALTAVYFYVKFVTFTYWQRRGIKYVPAQLPFGNFGDTFLQKKQMGLQLMDYYRSTTEPYLGLFATIRPVLLVCDLELIRSILIKDFQYFVNRGTYSDEKNDPLSAHLFNVDDEKWRNLRVKLSPTFTSGKLKAMFSTLLDCGMPLQRYIDKSAAKGETIELRELSARYTTDVIASVAFGVDINCIDNPDTAFRKFGRQFFDPTIKNGIRFALFFLFPKLLKLSRVGLIDKDIEDFMTAMVQQTLEHREKNNIVRKDFFQLLLQLRNTGNVQLDDQWETVITADEKGKKLTLTEMTARAFVFYIAGFETTSTTIAFCLFEIARNEEIQRRVHEEIDETLAKYDGKLTYDSIAAMKYLESCIDGKFWRIYCKWEMIIFFFSLNLSIETLRKYPVLPILNRECVKDYTIPGTDIVLEKGTAILIPALALSHDENYFPNPTKFDPKRFAEKNRSPSMSYIPFGDGPRNCIGMRLGKLQTKVGLILMMQNARYELGDKKYYNEELTMAPGGSLLAPEGGINLKITPRKCWMQNGHA